MTTAARPAPLTRHPAFRWGVAAWFALLLGLGLFVMPEAVHQAIGEKLGLGGVLPGAEAKRVVLSLLAALLGLGIGLVLAMRVTALSDAREPGWDREIAEDDEIDDESNGIWLSARVRPAPTVAPPSAPPIETRARRLFNPREDLAEEGIAPVLDTESIPALEDDNTESGLEETAPSDDEPVPHEPYFGDAWDGEQPEPHDWTLAGRDPLAHDEALAGLDEDIAAERTDEKSFPAEESVETSSFESFEEAKDTAPEHDGDNEGSATTGTGDERVPVADMPLDALTRRLADALAAQKQARKASVDADADPVIAFLRREAEREVTVASASDKSPSTEGDSQRELRSALDRLSRIRRSE
ncbi:MAG TPA: hypothetical protein DIW45_05520 [Erythrobacter sp.]|nr:hypothetical protein [Erythrobacter sp.]